MELHVKSKSKEKAFCGCLIYSYISTLFFISVGCICIYASSSIEKHVVASTPTNEQAVVDW